VDAQGNVYFMEQGAGRISWAPGGDMARHELFAKTGGSPLGGVVSQAGDLIYADAAKVHGLSPFIHPHLLVHSVDVA
jgi:hypothetical protein